MCTETSAPFTTLNFQNYGFGRDNLYMNEANKDKISMNKRHCQSCDSGSYFQGYFSQRDTSDVIKLSRHDDLPSADSLAFSVNFLEL